MSVFPGVNTALLINPNCHVIILTVKNKLVLPIIILVIFIFYTVIYTIQLNDIAGALLELIPGILGISVLLARGFTTQELYLRGALLSLKGLLLLLVFFLVLIPILITGKWVGFDPIHMLVLAPLGGITQELFFRASLLPLLIRILKSRPFTAIILHSTLFSIWHMPLVFSEAPLAGAIGVVVVTFIGGLIWGGQVHRDGTIYWAMGQHILYLMLMSLFTWG